MLRLLPPSLINRIAAGEVLERPASAVKELVENAIDAGARHIDILLIDGGKERLSVSDDGKGMTADELTLAVERHATSKLPDEDLFNLSFLGFRGEALPSIGAVSRMTITSKAAGTDEAWKITVDGGMKSDPEPVSAPSGTTVDVRDLFYAVPARLKFLKSATTEMTAVKDIVDRLALAYPAVSFVLSDEKKKRAEYPATERREERVKQVLGDDFADNAVPVHADRYGMTLTGFAGVPTFNKATSADQFFFVNGRPVRDKALLGAVKGAYRELMPSDRFPAVVLFLQLPHEDVDMNVHPTKAEVRFRNAADVRGLFVSAVRQAVIDGGCKTATSLSEQTLSLAETAAPAFVHIPRDTQSCRPSASYAFRENGNLFRAAETYAAPIPHDYVRPSLPEHETPAPLEEPETDDFPPLGLAKAQLHETYIVSQTKDGIVITDQHAAHERLTYEKLRRAEGQNDSAAQYLLLPEVVELGEKKTEDLTALAEELKKTGLLIESFGDDAVLVRATPSVLGEVDAKALIEDLAATAVEGAGTESLSERIKNVVARMACHGSVRAGRKLDISEMNALLRQMEAEPLAGQCIHGRPTYIELKLKDIEKLFGRRD